MRRRRAEQPNESDEPATEFLDEDEQQNIVHELENDIHKQQRQVLSAFRVLCTAAAVISLLFIFMGEVDGTLNEGTFSVHAQSWIHGFLSAGMHFTSLRFAALDVSTVVTLHVPLFLNILISSLCIWHARMIELPDIVHLHQGLVVANLVTLLGAFVVRWDRLDSERALREVAASKYRYKSL